MADNQWPAEQIREAMERLAHLDINGEIARAGDIGDLDTSRYREALQATSEFALHLLQLPLDAIPESEKERLASTAGWLQEQLLPLAERHISSSLDHMGGAASATGEAAKAVGEAAGDALEAIGEALSFLG